MDGYKRFAAICCLMTILTFKDSDAAVTGFSQAIAASGVAETVGLTTGTTATTTLTVAENFGSGTISTFTATGSDASGTWGADVGTIDSATGAFSMSTLDYETAPSHTVTITFTESGVDSTVTMTLTVTDVVAFTQVTYAETVTDGSGVGTTITTVTADNVATYELQATGNTDTVFGVSSAGVITIATGKTVDRATLKGYALTVLAKDSGVGGAQEIGTATVIIGVCPSTAAAVVASVVVILLTAGVTILS